MFQHFASQIAYAFCVRAATPTAGKSMCTGAEFRRPLHADRYRVTAMLPLQGHQCSTCIIPDANARCPPVCDGPLTSAEWLSPTLLGHSAFAPGAALPAPFRSFNNSDHTSCPNGLHVFPIGWLMLGGRLASRNKFFNVFLCGIRVQAVEDQCPLT